MPRTLIIVLIGFLFGNCNSTHANSPDLPDWGAIADVISAEHFQHPPRTDVPRRSARAVQYFLETLDPYSQYYSAGEYKKIRRKSAAPTGLGALITKVEQKLLMVPFINGPASEAGLHAPFWITQIDRLSLSGMDVQDIAKYLKKRDQVQLKGQDATTGKTVSSWVRLRSFDVPSVERLAYGDATVLRIHNFIAEHTTKRLIQEIKTLTPFQPLILDLRYSIGGSLLEGVDAASLFLDPDKPIAKTLEADGLSVPFSSKGAQRIWFRPVFILTSPSTASAAEIMARALQYNGYGVLVGRQTFGKCLMQRYFDLPKGDGLKLSVGKILGPDGSYCRGKGLKADLSVAMGQEHDTLALIKRIDQWRSSHALTCLGREINPDRHTFALRSAKWLDGIGKMKSGYMVDSGNNGRACLLPPQKTETAQVITKNQARKLNQTVIAIQLDGSVFTPKAQQSDQPIQVDRFGIRIGSFPRTNAMSVISRLNSILENNSVQGGQAQSYAYPITDGSGQTLYRIYAAPFSSRSGSKNYCQFLKDNFFPHLTCDGFTLCHLNGDKNPC